MESVPPINRFLLHGHWQDDQNRLLLDALRLLHAAKPSANLWIAAVDSDRHQGVHDPYPDGPLVVLPRTFFYSFTNW